MTPEVNYWLAARDQAAADLRQAWEWWKVSKELTPITDPMPFRRGLEIAGCQFETARAALLSLGVLS